MLITKFISTLLSWVRRPRATRLNEIESPELFRTVIDRERFRADGCVSNFALVVFSCPNGDCSTVKKNMQRLLSTIHDRIRCTDYAGWMGEDELGMLIVDCSTKQVKQLVMTLSAEFAATIGPLIYRIESYPDVPSSQIISPSEESDERAPVSSETMPA
ncbi:MAG: hypothetical protein HON53_23445 [Planctomycetaceae bacterium]|nr:hypothetical protein [Planctomycetaceae bacterium]MBT6153192.1 hypothetical protein [Planctomycetaceae bacterium]MBT6484614.1 hypothetical protein [Planctomycetaceae bacterium]MBT6495101.1 hypothetical protein [Planctomycetaceae bacterium]